MDNVDFVRHLALFFTGFFKVHRRLVETGQMLLAYNVLGHQYLCKISFVDDEEIFRICLEYWRSLVINFTQ